MVDSAIQKKVEQQLGRLAEVEQELGSPDVLQDQKAYRLLTQEHSHLSEVRDVWQELQKVETDLTEHQELLKAEAEDSDFAEMLREELEQLTTRHEELDRKIQVLLVPPNPYDHRSTVLELRAGTGGEEAALFVADCIRMYRFFADQMGWSVEDLGGTPSDRGGFKEYVMVLSGQNVHRYLQYEAGTHRVQRVPETETQGRVHTSAITCAVLMEPEEEDDVSIEEKDLRIDTFRASGAGGQHVNVTDSAVRITHLPTGIVVSCQDEKSQHKNKAKAMRHLKAKIVEIEEQKRLAEQASKRASQVGSGDRSERIRTYNFPQNRITDHRIQYTRHNLDQVMNGDLQELVEALVSYYYQQKFAV